MRLRENPYPDAHPSKNGGEKGLPQLKNIEGTHTFLLPQFSRERGAGSVRENDRTDPG
jgi:hypothetical protein